MDFNEEIDKIIEDSNEDSEEQEQDLGSVSSDIFKNILGGIAFFIVPIVAIIFMLFGCDKPVDSGVKLTPSQERELMRMEMENDRPMGNYDMVDP